MTDKNILNDNLENISTTSSLIVKKFEPTDEQLEIIQKAKNMKNGEILIVNALAGCAKTTTLQLIAEDNPNSKFLYLAFNHAIIEEGRKKFPANTKVSTLHALARSYSGKKEIKPLNLDLISSILKKQISNKQEYFEVFNILKVYEKYCLSAYDLNEVDELKKEISQEMNSEFKRKPNIKNSKFLIEQRIKAIYNIPEVHKNILNSNFTTFSTFLKEFADNANQIFLHYNYIVLDESQDISKLLGKFIISLAESKKYKIIVVGDNNQKIYGFLGNLNLSEILYKMYNKYPMIYVMKLTKTFRFYKNSDIETLANLVLHIRDDNIKGFRYKSSELQREAYISRTTFPLLAMAIYLITLNKKYNLFGGLDNFNQKEIEELYAIFIHTEKLIEIISNKYNKKFYDYPLNEQIELLAQNKDLTLFPLITTESLKSFSSFIELKEFVESRGISEVENNINIAIFIYSKMEDFKNIKSDKLNPVQKFFDLIEQYNDKDSSIIISTIHKTKGLEFEDVYILKSLSIIYSVFKNKYITFEQKKGLIMGLKRVELNSEKLQSNNVSLTNYFNKYGNSDKNIFQDLEDDHENDELSFFPKAYFENKMLSNVLYEQVIDYSTTNIKEEYNILYVAITRAINNIKISNINYIATLEFLTFVKDNAKELNKLIQGKESILTEELKIINRNKNISYVTGIIYQDSFIRKDTLIKLLPQL